jgi:hypothetical protein
VERVASLLRDDLQIRLPHVAADERERGGALFAQPAEELQERLRAAVLADPQQPLARRVDLIHERQEIRAVLPVDLIDADRANVGEIHVIPSRPVRKLRRGRIICRIDVIGGGRVLRETRSNRRPTRRILESGQPLRHASAMDPLPPPLAFFFLLFSGWGQSPAAGGH